MAKRVLAMDYGASSGRGIIGEFDGSSIRLSEVHRFSNDPVVAGDTMYWDVLRLLHELKATLSTCEKDGGVDSLAIDTWGVDFGLLDKYGRLLSNPVHYRDSRTNGMQSTCFDHMSAERLFDITGIQFMEINTLVQLLALKQQCGGMLEQASTILMMPDLLGYFLTGTRLCEYSIASTTQMLDAQKKTWSDEVLSAFGIPGSVLPQVSPSGTSLGMLSKSIVDELNLSYCPEVIAACGHDTADAMLATPSDREDFIFISCGTWALFGTELDGPVLDRKALQYDLSNEGGYAGKTSFLKNITGTWLIQESRRQWKKEGRDYSFSDLEKMAAEEKPFVSFINPSAPEFTAAGNMPERIRDYCSRTGQPVPETEGQIVRCIDESLALAYRATLEEVADCTGKDYDRIHLLGGGSQSKLLCEMTASATGREVLGGPVEATVLGNIAIQLIKAGELSGMEEARKLIGESDDIIRYEPDGKPQWVEAFERFSSICNQ